MLTCAVSALLTIPLPDRSDYSQFLPHPLPHSGGLIRIPLCNEKPSTLDPKRDDYEHAQHLLLAREVDLGTQFISNIHALYYDLMLIAVLF